MQASVEEADKLSLLSQYAGLVDFPTINQLRHILNNLPPAEIAHHIESAPPKIRRILWEFVDEDLDGEVLGELSEGLRQEFLRSMDSEELAAAMEGMDPDDVVDLLQQLPDRVIPEVLQAMDDQNRQRVEQMLSYAEDTAGGLMNTDTITVRPDLSLDVILRYLRRHEELPRATDNLFVVNRKDTFLGILPIAKLLTSSPSLTVREVMVTDVQPIPATMPDTEVAQRFERYDWVTAPVVDDGNKLLGRITIDDVVDVIIGEADHSLLGLAGLSDEEETFTSVRHSAPRRAFWLGINLCTAILASAVVGLFEATLDQVVALAILMPIVASMGGIAGSQTLTVVVRGMALGHVNPNNLRWLLSKEFLIGAINALLWALVIGSIAAWWFEDPRIGYIIAAAMVINLVMAAVAGTLLPVTLKALRIDPALAGGVVLTTITDVVGFFAFLGLATLFYF
ncbi:MAG TPA: magnesium transporter [Porticoccaceae bacterium]|nr:magnesium transporter [Porticoccaceae bacterium]